MGVGGSGRQSLARLAAYIEDFEVFQIEISKNYRLPEWRDDLRIVLRKAGEEDKSVLFLFTDTQIKEESFVEDINSVLNTGEVPNLFDSNDISVITEAIRGRAKKVGKHTSRADLISFFVDECRRNLHIALCFSPIGDAFRERLRKFPSLVNCCTIDWFSAWPADALLSVARRFLDEIDVKAEDKSKLVKMSMHFHQSVKNSAKTFLEELRRHYYVTPTSYLELITIYKTLLKEQQAKVSGLRNRYEVGLEQLRTAEDSVTIMQGELEEMQPKLIQSSKEVSELIVQIDHDSVFANEKRTVVKGEEEIASTKAAEAKAIKDDTEAQLAEAMPVLEKAIKALDWPLVQYFIHDKKTKPK